MKKHVHLLVTLVFSICKITTAIAQPVGMKADLGKRIVRVFSGSKHSTGFAYSSGSHIVTTLHTIADKNSIQLRMNDGTYAKATIQAVLRHADLVLLKADRVVCPSFFTIPAPSPAADTELFTLGFYLDNDTYTDRDLRAGVVGGKPASNIVLGDLLFGTVKEAVINAGVPKIDTRIVYLKGEFMHGYSGAPVMDLQGALVAIADGGIEQGANSVNWGIAAHYLTQLMQSKDVLIQALPSTLSQLFKADEYVDLGVAVSGGGFTFKKLYSKSFYELNLSGKYTTNEAWGLQQTMNMINSFGLYYMDNEFDVYAETKTGYTLLVPKDVPLQFDGTAFIANGNGDHRLVCYATWTSDIQLSYLAFSENLMPGFTTGMPRWNFDPTIPMHPPQPGLYSITQRGALYEVLLNDMYVVQNIASKPAIGLLAGTYSIVEKFDPLKMNSDPEDWISFLLAGQLSTFTY